MAIVSTVTVNRYRWAPILTPLTTAANAVTTRAGCCSRHRLGEHRKLTRVKPPQDAGSFEAVERGIFPWIGARRVARHSTRTAGRAAQHRGLWRA